MTARILIIAGSDSSGGAGIQADIKTVTMLGGHAMTAITAVTAQNTLGVDAVHPIPTEMVIAQIDACVSDIGVDAVKIGMIGSAETADAVADRLAGLDVPIVFDPVMVATSGDSLADAETIPAFERLMGIASLTTPNLPELAALGGEAAMLGPTLVKGGHSEGDVIVDRLVAGGKEIARWQDKRIMTTSTHGTGCTLASAVATALGEGLSLEAAIENARLFVRLALRDAPGLGGGHGPMGHQAVRLDCGPEMRLNQISIPGLAASAPARKFYETLGLRCIVESLSGEYEYLRFEAPGGVTLSSYPGGEGVYFECDDVDATVSRLRAADIMFDQLPTDQPWGWRQAWTRDPAGNPVCLFQAGENRRYPPWRLP